MIKTNDSSQLLRSCCSLWPQCHTKPELPQHNMYVTKRVLMLAAQSDPVAVEGAQLVKRALGEESGGFGWSSVSHE